MEEEVQSKEMEAGGGNPRPCLVAPVNLSIKYRLIIKLITELVCKLRDEFIKAN